MMDLKERLVDWTDRDVVMFEIVVSLSLIPKDSKFSERKGSVLTNNPIANVASRTLDALLENGMMEHDYMEDKFRWKKEKAS